MLRDPRDPSHGTNASDSRSFFEYRPSRSGRRDLRTKATVGIGCANNASDAALASIGLRTPANKETGGTHRATARGHEELAGLPAERESVWKTFLDFTFHVAHIHVRKALAL